MAEPKPKKDWKEKLQDAQDNFVTTLNKKFEAVEDANWKESVSEK